MSWKGFQKSVIRTPQTLQQRFNIGEITKDAVFMDAERRFQELEQETKKLHDESKKYFDAINGMLNHQLGFSRACKEIYNPISGRASDPESYVIDSNPEGIRACDEYEAVVAELQETIAPELEMIENRVIKPADELLEVLKIIRKSATKRDHKQLDYDRQNAALKKLQDKKEKTLKDEKALYKAENDVELATQEFNYYNDLLKDELPKLFLLEREFIKPLFQSFYYMQLNLFYTLHERMQNVDIGYFDLSLDIEAAFEKKRGDVQDRVEELTIVHFKTTGGLKRGEARLKAKLTGKSDASSTVSGRRNTLESSDTPPPPYSPGNASTSPPYSATTAEMGGSAAGGWGAAAKSKPAPPPPKPKPGRLAGHQVVETVTALYDFEAQAEGDLSFTTGDVIEIVQRTQNANEWWTGKVDGRQGQFPGNYVRLN